jgi:Lon protease-like protein
MFPLGTVLVPSLALPLHVFEERYRALVRHCLAGDREFGVVLIERGSEVGGDDTRTGVGTVARIHEVVELPDGRFAVASVGTRRIRVTSWLPDDPYPRAEVEDWPDPTPGPGGLLLLEIAVLRLRRVLAMAAEAGDPAPPSTIELSDDPVLVSYQAAALAPLGPFDQQRLLAAGSVEQRLSLLVELLDDAAALLEARLTGG